MSLVIGELPTLFLSADDLPVPDAVYRQTDDAIKEYFKLDSAMGVDFSDLKLDVDMARDGFARNPGNAFAILRNVYQKIVSRIGKYLWIEAENPSSTTFGFSASSAAASDGKYLAVDTPFEPLDGAYKASYSINVPDNTTLRLLIAGSLPEEGTLHFEVSIGTSPPIPVNSEPLSLYGGSFAWYDAGTVALSKGRTTLTIAVRGAPGAYYQASLDAILLTAGAFTPSGVRRPTVPYPGK
jgi:hypothetical protein